MLLQLLCSLQLCALRIFDLTSTVMFAFLFHPPVLMDEGKEEEAIAELSGAVAFKPDLQLLHLRAAFFDSMGDSESALRDCEAALCLDPTHGDTLELYSKASTKADEPQS